MSSVHELTEINQERTSHLTARPSVMMESLSMQSPFGAHFRLSRLSSTAKLFVSLFLCLTALCYITLLASIWNDTEFKMRYIIEGYGSMGVIELVQHSFRYSFWFLAVFAVTVALLLATSIPDHWKKFFTITSFVLILSDIGSTWLIPHHSFFAYQLAASGFLLGLCFLTMFILIQRELWFVTPQSLQG